MLRLLCLFCLIIGLSGCATSSFEVLDINTLSSDLDDNGSFKGLERLAQKSPENHKKIRVNIIYLHGIGYVENPEDAPLANALRANADAMIKTKIFAYPILSAYPTLRLEITKPPFPVPQSN